MTDRSPTSNGVWIPLPLATLLFECYYGNGPRSRGRTDSPPTLPVSPLKDEEGDHSTPVPIEHGMKTTAAPGPAWRPRGILEKTKPDPDSSRSET